MSDWFEYGKLCRKMRKQSKTPIEKLTADIGITKMHLMDMEFGRRNPDLLVDYWTKEKSDDPR